MNRVMVDNWFLGEVVRYLRSPEENPSRPYAELLMALVLWDEVCYPENGLSRSWAGNSLPADCLCPIDDSRRELADGARELLMLYAAGDPGHDPYFLWMQDPESIVNAAALRYLMLSAKHGCDYLPSTRRQAFLKAHENPKHMKDLLLRMRMLGTLDEAAEAYYRESLQALLDFSELKLAMPVLADYILDGTPAGMTPVEYALQLRQEGPVIRYRAYLARVEQALEAQDWKQLRQLLAASREAVEGVLALDRKRTGSVTVKLLPTPSVVVNYGGVKGELSASPGLSFELKPGRKMHLTFLKELTAYAIHDRKLFPQTP